MIKTVVLIALMFIAIFMLLRWLAGNNRTRDSYIQRDYEKFKRLDEQLEQQTTVCEPPAGEHRPHSMP
jgi:hypothetical protein